MAQKAVRRVVVAEWIISYKCIQFCPERRVCNRTVNGLRGRGHLSSASLTAGRWSAQGAATDIRQGVRHARVMIFSWITCGIWILIDNGSANHHAPMKCVWRTCRKVDEVSHHDNILYMFYGSFYVICILTYLYSLHKYRPLDHNTNYISQRAGFVLIFSSLCLYCPVLYQELSKLNEVCNIISLETQIHVTRWAQ